MNSSHNFKDNTDAIHAGVMSAHGAQFGVGGPGKAPAKSSPKAPPGMHMEGDPMGRHSYVADSHVEPKTPPLSVGSEGPLHHDVGIMEAGSTLTSPSYPTVKAGQSTAALQGIAGGSTGVGGVTPTTADPDKKKGTLPGQ